MSVSIEIQPHSSSLDMYGEPDRSTAYSLSGDIVISVSSPFSFFERRKPVKILLQSITVEFEGQCELITDDTGYTPFRVYSLSSELLTEQTIELSNEGHEEDDKPCAWSVAYNLVVPGWLPPTAAYGNHRAASEPGTRYALYASAKFVTIDDDANRSWLAACCTAFRSRARVVDAPRCCICVNRFANLADDASSTIDYRVQAVPKEDRESATRFPSNVMSSLRTIVSVPTNIDVEDTAFPVCMRLRLQDLTEAECRRVRMTDFTVDIEQTEQCRSSPSSLYKTLYPLPPPSEQPPRRPLRDPHPAQTLCDVGLAVIPAPHHTITTTHSLFPLDACGEYALAGDGYVFKDDAAPANGSTWFSVRTQIPVDSARCSAKTGVRRLRATGMSPLFCVSHRLLVSLTCTYDLEEGEGEGGEPARATEVLQFSIPVRFARVQRDPAAPFAPGRAQVVDGVRAQGPLAAALFPKASLPYAQTLPAYSQLFDANGDRKIDYSVPLPAYSPASSASSTACVDLLLPLTASFNDPTDTCEAVLPGYSAA